MIAVPAAHKAGAEGFRQLDRLCHSPRPHDRAQSVIPGNDFQARSRRLHLDLGTRLHQTLPYPRDVHRQSFNAVAAYPAKIRLQQNSDGGSGIFVRDVHLLQGLNAELPELIVGNVSFFFAVIVAHDSFLHRPIDLNRTVP